MIKKNTHTMYALKYVIAAAIVLAGFNQALAQNNTDTTKKLLLASANTHHELEYIIKDANVTFPDILHGNEGASVGYVSAFSNKRRDYLMNMRAKGKKLLPQVSDILKKYNLPQELGVLLLLESAGEANAVSKSGAVGYWQFMKEPAKEYGLKCVQKVSAREKKKMYHQNPKRAKAFFKALARQKDERKNFNKSTLAAAHYLYDRSVNFNNNWLLVVASYNCGVGNVWSAMEKSGMVNPTFWDVKKYLPAETQAYVMNFITLNVIFNNYDNFLNNNLSFIPLKIVVPDNTEFISAPEAE